METVKAFNEELSGIYETKPPISRAKMTLLTKKAIKGIKYYKHIVQSMEKFVQKCRPEYKVPGLYVIDSVVRQSRHQFGPEKDVFMPRLCKNILTTFQHIYKCPPEEKPRILRVLNLWQKNSVFPQDIVQQLTVMGGAPTLENAQTSAGTTAAPIKDLSQKQSEPDQANLTNLLANLISNPDANQVQNLAGLLSSTQQNQLEDLLKQVKGADQWCFESEEERIQTYFQPNHKDPSPPPQVNIMPTGNVFQQQRPQPPYQQPQIANEPRKQPTFNREVLDFDYSDDEQTPPAKVAKHSIDPNLLAKLPTADQIQQLTGARHGLARAGMPARMDPELERRQRLEQEQAIFNKQIQEMEENSKKSESVSRSDREGSHRRKRSRSRSPSRDGRHHRHHRKRSHSRDRHRSRRSRSREHSRRSRRSRSKSHDRRREKKGFPPIKDGHVSVCTTTLWIGNISSKVMQHELQALVEEYGKVESINMIPPRGCAYVCMKDRQEADRALHKVKHYRLGGKSLKCDWAPSKEMPEEHKGTWVKDLGVNYVQLMSDPTLLRNLSQWGCIDMDSVPQHRRDELNPPEPEMESEPEETAPPAIQPHMIPSFNPASAAAASTATIMPRPPMPVMVRPFQLNPFGMQQRLNLGQPASVPERPPVQAVVSTPVPVPAPDPDTSTDMKLDSPGSKTPTADEHVDEPTQQAQPMQIQQAQAMPQFRPQFGPVSIAQRFSGAVPVQLQMMPNMGQQQIMPRMGMMPIRMGVPMQIRPGFHPGMQHRLTMQGHPQMMQNHPMRPSMGQAMHHQPGPFRPNVGMAMHGQRPMGMMQRPEAATMHQRPPMDRRPSTPSNDPGQDQKNEPKPPEFGGSTPPVERQRGFHDGPVPERPRLPMNRPPMMRPGEFNRPRFDQGPRHMVRLPHMVRPPHGMIRGPQDQLMMRPHDSAMDRPPQDLSENNDRPPRDLEGPPRDLDGPPREIDGPPRGMDGPSRGMDGPSRGMDGPPRDLDGPPRDLDGPPRIMDRPPRDMDRPPRDMDRPPRDMDRPPRDMDRPPRDMDRPPRDIDRPPINMDRPPRDMDRPPRDRDMGRPPRDMDRPPRDMDRPPRDRDMDRHSRDSDRPSRDGDRGSRDRRDYDRGRRDRSRDRDRRDRDADRDRRRRVIDMDRRGRDRDTSRDRRDRDRDRDFDRRDRGPPRGGRGGFRGGRDDRGRGRGMGRGGRGNGFSRGRGGRDSGRYSPEIDPEEEEYQRKRQEILRKRHEEDDEYVVEEIDFSAFGLPCGFGGTAIADGNSADSKGDSKSKDPSPSHRDRQRRGSVEDSKMKSSDSQNNGGDASVPKSKDTSEIANEDAPLDESELPTPTQTNVTEDLVEKPPAEDETHPSPQESRSPLQEPEFTSQDVDRTSPPPESIQEPFNERKNNFADDENGVISTQAPVKSLEDEQSPGTPTIDEQGNHFNEDMKQQDGIMNEQDGDVKDQDADMKEQDADMKEQDADIKELDNEVEATE